MFDFAPIAQHYGTVQVPASKFILMLQVIKSDQNKSFLCQHQVSIKNVCCEAYCVIQV